MTLDREMNRLRKMLLKHEGLRLKPYKCTAGKTTIGVGRNLEDVGITEAEAMILLAHDIARVHREAVESFAWFKSISTLRQDVVLDMLINLGLPRFKGFKKMIAAISAGNFDKAADEMLSSKWAEQVGPRAKDLAHMMRTNQTL